MSTTYEILAKALTNILRNDRSDKQEYQEVEYKVLNPKVLSMDELYGYYNTHSGEWNEGIVGLFMIDYANREDENYRWVIFDGPVDSCWVENMNTVLDDNMMLCLANTQRVKLKQEMRVMFEVLDLHAATPATISRCGVVYMG